MNTRSAFIVGLCVLVAFAGCITKQPNAMSPNGTSAVSPDAAERIQEFATTPTNPKTPSARYKVNITKVEHLIHKEVNERRRAHGVETLEYQLKLAKVGRYKSWHMAKEDYIEHTGPDGTSHNELRKQFNASCNVDGQNLYVSRPLRNGKTTERAPKPTGRLATEIITRLMNSSPHRKNILNPKYDIEGIGVFIDKSGTIYVTQELCGYY